MLCKLWFNENMRIFHDRLTTEDDRTYLKDLLVSHFDKFDLLKDQVLDIERIIFADFLYGRDSEPKMY
jgi:dynein heavy chain